MVSDKVHDGIKKNINNNSRLGGLGTQNNDEDVFRTGLKCPRQECGPGKSIARFIVYSAPVN